LREYWRDQGEDEEECGRTRHVISVVVSSSVDQAGVNLSLKMWRKKMWRRL
jgi:hypothetical protein